MIHESISNWVFQLISSCFFVAAFDGRGNLGGWTVRSVRQAVIKNADMAEDMQQDAIDCATQALEKYNIETLGEVLNGWESTMVVTCGYHVAGPPLVGGRVVLKVFFYNNSVASR